VSKQRTRQIVAGAVVARTTMQSLNIEQVAISPWALREGIILSRLDASDGGAHRDEKRALLAVAAAQANGGRGTPDRAKQRWPKEKSLAAARSLSSSEEHATRP
jgi:exopolyphosphatase/pppGpp-phosphohydrolase